MRVKKKKHIFLKVVCALAAVAVLCYLAVFAVVCINEHHLPPVENYDAIVVLGAQIEKDGTPKLQLQWRLDKAIEMYEPVQCPIVVCGGQGADEPRPEGEAMAEYLQQHGIPEEKILVDSASSNTRQNIRNAVKLLQTSGAKKVLVVTSAYHLTRALAIAEDEGMEACGVGSPIKNRYWLKNHAREALAMVKYWGQKYNILPSGV